MDSWAFEQLNRLLTPDQSPQNGPGSEAERSESNLSFPVSGSALQAQLEAWTNVAFDFESAPEFASPNQAPKDLASAAALGPSFGIDNYALGLNSLFQFDDALLRTLPPAPRDSDPYGHDLYLPVAGATLAPAPAGSASAAAAAARGPKAGTGLPAKKRRQSSSAGSAASPPDEVNVAATPAPVAATPGDDELNALAVEEDKRRRNTAASARFRIKKKQREQALESTAKELRDRVNTLEREVEGLRTENGWLRGLIVGKEESERKAKEEANAAAAKKDESVAA